jgi:hypothetical protein
MTTGLFGKRTLSFIKTKITTTKKPVRISSEVAVTFCIVTRKE